MSGEIVRARLQAVKTIGLGVDSYGRAVQQALASARSDLNAAVAEFQLALALTERRLAEARRRREGAQQALSACRENCEPLERSLAEARVAESVAERDHEKNRRAKDQLDRIATELQSSMRTIQASSEQLVPSARRNILSYGEAISDFLTRAPS